MRLSLRETAIGGDETSAIDTVSFTGSLIMLLRLAQFRRYPDFYEMFTTVGPVACDEQSADPENDGCSSCQTTPLFRAVAGGQDAMSKQSTDFDGKRPL